MFVFTVNPGGTSRASGMLLHYKAMGSQDAQQLRMEAAEDKKVASMWLAAMHKVQRANKIMVIILDVIRK